MAIINITIYYDTTCPWCYIGHRILDQAIALYQRTFPGGRNDTFVLSFRPFYLDASAPLQGVPMTEKMALKNGAERVNAIQNRLQRVGKANGIVFSFGGKTGNTRTSHQLLHQTGRLKSSEMQKQLLEEIYAMHFERNGDITSAQSLLDVAVNAGLQAAEARSWMSDEAIGKEVDQLASEARAADVSSVPTVEVNGGRIEGAEDASAFYEAFVKARETAS